MKKNKINPAKSKFSVLEQLCKSILGIWLPRSRVKPEWKSRRVPWAGRQDSERSAGL